MSGERRTLPPGWRRVRLGNICQFLSGGTPSKDIDEYWNGDIPWVSPKDVKVDVIYTTTNLISRNAVDSSTTRVVEPGTILCVTRSGILAHSFPVALAGKHVAFNQDIRALVPNKTKVDSSYLYYVLRDMSQKIVADGVKKGPTVHSLRANFLENLHVPLPPLDLQQAIVRQLERDMAEVERLRVASEHQWDAIAKLPQASLRQVFEDEDAHNWLHVPLDEVCSIVEGQVDPRLPEYRGLPHINGEVIETGTGRLLNYRTVGEDRVTSGKYYFNAGSVIYSKLRPYLRKVVLVDFQGLCSADAYPITTNPQFLSPLWLKWSLLTDTFTAYASEESLRSRMPKLNREQLLSWRIPLPDMPTQNRIAKQLEGNLEGVVTMRRHAERQRAAIEALPGALLGEVFGEAAP
jgi:type I restriction enzyme, S subunit